jgi:hypothetical protein
MVEEAKVDDSEPEVIIEEPEVQPDTEVEVESEAPLPGDSKKKEDWVELPPDAQRKFNDMYKQTKMSDQRNKFLLDANEKALKRIEELESRFKDTDQAHAEQVIFSKIQEARDNGDTQAELRLIGDLTDFKAEQKIRNAQPKKEESRQVDFGLPQEDIDYLKETVFEKDDGGKFVRPWLHENSPRYSTTLKQSAIISAEVEAELGYVDAREVMNRLEKIMTQKPTTPRPANNRAPDPLQSGLTSRNPRGTLRLTPAEAAIADKLGIDPKVYAQSRESLKRKQ